MHFDQESVLGRSASRAPGWAWFPLAVAALGLGVMGCSAVLGSSEFDFDGADGGSPLDATSTPDATVDAGSLDAGGPDAGPEPDCVEASECPPVAGATVACEVGECVFTCQALRADCNGDPSDGCETDLSDPDTCGGCETACDSEELCDASGATPVCAFDCPAPGAICEPRRCIDTSTNVDHCGECAQACAGEAATAFVCEAGTCRVTECASGRADCNEDPADGCEITLADDEQHCGACERACDAGAVCEHAFCDPVEDVALGFYHTCVRRRSGRLQCWGNNERGALGDGTGVDRGRPVDVLDGVSNVSAQEHATCAIRMGILQCWGRGNRYHLGNGSLADRLSPTLVTGASAFSSRSFEQVALGFDGACALDTMGDVWCWGRNSQGQVGDGTTEPRSSAVPVVGLPGPAIAIASGAAHVCALLADGRVFCWGRNAVGQLGDGSQDDASSPREAGVGLGAVAIAAGESNTCAIVAEGALRCWGSRTEGIVQESTVGVATEPTPITAPAAVREIAFGRRVAFARTDAGTFVWGLGRNGAFGDAENSGAVSTTLTPVPGVGASERLAAGWLTACAIRRGQPLCWGWDVMGGTGRDRRLARLTPREVADVGGALTDVTDLASGELHTCLIVGTEVRCAGINDFGQLGIGDSFAWRWATSLPRAVSPAPIGTPTRVAAGGFFSCALYRTDAADRIFCWGDGREGQLGPNRVEIRTSPAGLLSDDLEAFPAAGEVVDLAAGAFHACAIIEHEGERRPACWGRNEQAQSGRPASATPVGPAFVGDITDAEELALGAAHTCVRRSSGAVACWGRPSALGVAPPPSAASAHQPVAPGVSDVRRIAAGNHHTCVALGATGALSCWGENARGQAAPGTATPVATPTLVAGVDGVTELALGGLHTCVASADGSARCFGANEHGQLGDGTQEDRELAAVVGLDDVERLVAPTGRQNLPLNSRFTCALRTGDRAACWGGNAWGRLADGQPDHVTPAPMEELQ